MKKEILLALALAALSFLLALGFGCSTLTGTGGHKDVPRMSIDELKSRLADPSLALIDVRAAKDWSGSSLKIKGAVREDPEKVSAWAAKYPKDKTLVLYCA